MASSSTEWVHLRGGGVSLLLAPDRWGLPAVAHWGAALDGDADVQGLLTTGTPAVLNSSLDAPRSFSIAASRQHGWSGTAAVELQVGRASGGPLTLVETTAEPTSARFVLSDRERQAEITYEYRLDAAGVLHATAVIRNATAGQELTVSALRLLLPLPARATEVLDFTGRWSGERHPQRRRIGDGTWTRSSRRGRPGHDSAFLTLAGTPGFSFRSGEIWAAHIAWSGNQEQIVERLPEGAGVHSAVIGGGELLDLGEILLGPGEAYQSPEVLFAWGDRGIDGVTDRIHRSVRALPAHPSTPRPLVLNTWEAVYFEHDLERLTELAKRAADIGVERFVLDDGWFRGRRDDTAGLGDWSVDETVWPHGLRGLSDRVHELGMQFGLWFEPEMVNPDSDLARAHPEWLLGELPDLRWRHQFALDLSQPAVATYLLDRIDAVVTDCAVDFIKWDHNRDLHAARGAAGAPRVHEHTLAVYRLLDQLRARHPALEIESCASGGARADLGIMSRTHRVWVSDTNDPIERQLIQRWTQTLLPPELLGTHVGPMRAHTTQRSTALSFRLVTALFGHAGIEWDLTSCGPAELDGLARWARLYKELRPLLHSGRTVRADHVDAGALLHGVVSDDAAHAVFAWVRLHTSPAAHTARSALPGLDPDRHYLLRTRPETGPAARHQVADPGWFSRAERGIVLSGRVLTREGVPLPLLNPGQAMLLELIAAR
ncbi:alpha-galactosidase [Plantactinospora sp. ZYX-F-223]|uniref:alpha-galactosidase n=1 Tax=Plantactinospora sp. ZYX-F-223 TaxID=3144103 RepID=UPI0031FC176D